MDKLIIELTGCDRSGKSTLNSAIGEHYNREYGIGKQFAHICVIDRWLYDSIALDRYFDRVIPEVETARKQFLLDNKDRMTIIWTYASVPVLEARQKEQKGLDGSDYNKIVIDMQKMSDIYKELFDELGKDLDLHIFDTDVRSPEEIVESLIEQGILD